MSDKITKKLYDDIHSIMVEAASSASFSGKKTDHITQFAAKAHEEWRRNFDPTRTKPRIKKNSDGTEGDINVPFASLHPDWQKENLAAAHAAHHAVIHFGHDTEKAADHIHKEWMKRNPKADYNAAQHVPYSQLPEDEKEKDRAHVRTMMQLMGRSPKQGVAESFVVRDRKGGVVSVHAAESDAIKAAEGTKHTVTYKRSAVMPASDNPPAHPKARDPITGKEHPDYGNSAMMARFARFDPPPPVEKDPNDLSKHNSMPGKNGHPAHPTIMDADGKRLDLIGRGNRPAPPLNPSKPVIRRSLEIWARRNGHHDNITITQHPTTKTWKVSGQPSNSDQVYTSHWTHRNDRNDFTPASEKKGVSEAAPAGLQRAGKIVGGAIGAGIGAVTAGLPAALAGGMVAGTGGAIGAGLAGAAGGVRAGARLGRGAGKLGPVGHLPEELLGEAEWKMNSHADHAKAKIAYTDFVKKHGEENVRWGSKNKLGVPTIEVRTANQSVKEETLDELNKDTMYSYMRKSEADRDAQYKKIGKGIRDNDPKSANTAGHKYTMRGIGQDRAETRLAKGDREVSTLDRLAREDYDISLDEIPLEDIEAFMQTEDYDQLDELSKTTLGNYLKAASNDVAAKGAATRQLAVNARAEQEKQGGYKTRSVRDLEGKTDNMFKRSWARRRSMGKAVDRLTREEVDLDEALTTLQPGRYGGMDVVHKATGERIGGVVGPKGPNDIYVGVHGSGPGFPDQQEFKSQSAAHEWVRDRQANTTRFTKALIRATSPMPSDGTPRLPPSARQRTKVAEEADLTYEDYAMAILTLGGYDSFGDIDKEDMQDVMEAIDNAYYADDVEVFVRAFSQTNQEE